MGLCLVVMLLTACPAAAPPSSSPPPQPWSSGASPTSRTPSPTPSPTPLLAAFDAATAVAVATELAAAGPRPAGSERDAQARAEIAERLRVAGWTVAEEPFALPQGGETANVVAWLGAQRPQGPHVVVGGHLDTVADSPGANDNGTGVGAVVALAEELHDEAPPVPVVLVAFGAEEYQPSDPREHHLGSAAYVASHGGSVVAALSIDMVGNGVTTCICWYDAGPDTLARRLGSIAVTLPGSFEVRVERDISDHGPFALAGIPGAFLWTGRDGRYDSPADTAEHLVVADVQRTGDLALAFIRSLTADDLDGLEPTQPAR